MKKAFFLIGFCICIGTRSHALTPVEAYGPLRVEGKYIVSEDGTPVQLTGMCLFWSQWAGNLWNTSVVDWLVDDWKCSVLRLSMGVAMGGYIENPTTEMNRVITVVDRCIERGIYAIVDWHVEAPTPYEAQAIPFFEELARKYGNTPNVMYELWNEPHNNPWAEVKGYCERVGGAIRNIDPDNIIFCATPSWDRQIHYPTLPGAAVQLSNVVYVVHFYAATDGQSLRDLMNNVAGRNVPLFATEWGTSEGTGDGRIDLQSTQAFWDVMDQHKIGHTNWSIVQKGETSAAITVSASSNGGWTDADLTPSGRAVRAKLRSYPEPSVGTMREALRPVIVPYAAGGEAVVLQLNGRTHRHIVANACNENMSAFQALVIMKPGTFIHKIKVVDY